MSGKKGRDVKMISVTVKYQGEGGGVTSFRVVRIGGRDTPLRGWGLLY